MVLAVDIGNTTACVGLVREEAGILKALERIHLPSDTREDSKQLAQRIVSGLGLAGREVEGSAISSVVPGLAARLAEAVRLLLGREPLLVSKESALGLLGFEADMSTVGHDRLVDAAYAAHILPCPLLTVDMGTATTFNVVGEGKVFLGGLICAGLRTGLWALSAKTAQLPDLVPDKAQGLIGKDTRGCMLSGAVYGQAALIDGIAARVEEALGRKVSLAITGGWAGEVERKVFHPHLYEPDLMLKGLAYQYSLHEG